MCETADLRVKSQREKLCYWYEGRRLYRLYWASYDDHLKIEAEGAFVYGMLRHFTYVAGVFFPFLFSLLFCLLLSTFISVLPWMV